LLVVFAEVVVGVAAVEAALVGPAMLDWNHFLSPGYWQVLGRLSVLVWVVVLLLADDCCFEFFDFFDCFLNHLQWFNDSSDYVSVNDCVRQCVK